MAWCLPLFGHVEDWGRQDWDQFMFRYATPRLALLRDHVLPSWNPYASGGTVLLAHPDSPVLSPWYASVLLLGAPLGLRVQVALFTALGTTGMAALAIRLGATRAAAIVGGMTFMMGSHFALHVAEGHMEWGVLGLMPWVIVLVLEGQRRHVLGAALLLGSALSFGSVYIPAVYLPFLSAWMLLESIRAQRLTPLLRWLGTVAVALALAAVKLVPTLAFTSGTSRYVKEDQYTRPPVLAVALFHPDQARLYQAWRDRHLEEGQPGKLMTAAAARPYLDLLERLEVDEGFHEYGNYIGVIGILLSAWGIVRTARRHWPLYVAGAGAIIVAMGSSSPVDVWGAMRHLPLYNQMQVPARFGAAVLLALSVSAALGLTALVRSARGPFHRAPAVTQAVLAIMLFAELAGIGWRLLGDVFVMPPAPLPVQPTFTQAYRDRFAPEVVATGYDRLSQSAMYPQMMANAGTIDAYENLAVDSGRIRTPADSGYRGEAYAQGGHGTVRQARWTMSRVTLALELQQTDSIVLNQNFHRGWTATLRAHDGRVTTRPAGANRDGLVSVAAEPEHVEVTFRYMPPGLALGATVSLVTLLATLAVFFGPRGSRTDAVRA